MTTRYSKRLIALAIESDGPSSAFIGSDLKF